MESANQTNTANVETCEISNACNNVEIINAAAWQNRNGNNKRSRMSHGISADFCGSTEMEPRRREARRDARRCVTESEKIEEGGKKL